MTAATERVRAAIESFNRGGIEEMLPHFSADAEWHSAPGWAGKEIYVGEAGVRELVAEWTDSFAEYRWDALQFLELSPRWVLCLVEHKGRTREGVEVDAPLGAIAELGEGTIVSMRSYFTWEETLRAGADVCKR